MRSATSCGPSTGNSTEPLAPFLRRSAEELGPEGAALRALLTNRDPARFDELYAAVPEATRAAVRTLSPALTATRLLAPAEILCAPRDTYFPLDEALALTRLAPGVRVTVTSVLGHATPQLSPRKVTGLIAMDGFIVRSLAAARA
jgi:pimeloyl-ACP methyl ester carboxylesterase